MQKKMQEPKINPLGFLVRDHVEKMHHIMASFEEAYHILPICWHCDDDYSSKGMHLSKNEINMMHTVFLYCISPIVFKQQYLDTELNELADIAGFLPRNSEGIFDPEEHDSDREEACYKIVNVVHKFMLFMFNLLKEDRLQHIAYRVFRFGKDSMMCMEECRKLCKDYFDGQIHDKRVVALFAITLAVVSETARWEVIVERFKFLQDNAANDCRRFAEIAKECVKKADYATAISLYKQSIGFRPYDHFTYSNLAQIYLKMKKYQFAMWCAQRAIWIDHSWPKSHYRFIQALDCQGHLLKAWSLSTAVALLAENNVSYFSGSVELLQDLIKQRDSLGERARKFRSLPMEYESVKNRKKKRVQIKNSTTTVLSSDIVNMQKSSAKEKTSDPSVDDSKGASTVSKEAVFHNMPSVPEITSINIDAHECIDQSNADLNLVSLTKQKPVKNVGNEECVPLQGLVINNSKGGKARHNVQNFNKYMQEGSEALIMLSFKVAYAKYSLVLGVLQAKGKKALGLSELNIIVLKYCYAKACIGKGANEDINLGLKTLDEIINDHYTISFPLAYYGKALGFIALNRYKEAKDPLKNLLSIIDNKIKLEVYVFPNLESKIIEESHPEKLQELAKTLTSICNAPPPPNAVCRYITDDNSHRSEIYFSDPGFQGFAQIICYERCHLSYHVPCWKEIKEDKKLNFEKDFLGKPCFTPDCNATISRIELFGADGMKRKTFPSEDDIKLKLKDNVTSKLPKETKKSAKPMVKKMYNFSHERSSISEQATTNRLSMHRQSDSTSEEKRNDFAVADTRQNADMVLQKKFFDDSILQVEKKKQLKKSKAKGILPLDFAKTDDPRIEQLKTMKVAAESDFSNAIPPRQFHLDHVHPFAVPLHIRENVVEMEKWLQASYNENNEKTRTRSTEFPRNFTGQYRSMLNVNDRGRLPHEHFTKKSRVGNDEDKCEIPRQPEEVWKSDRITSNNIFSKERAAFFSEANLFNNYSEDNDLPLCSYSDKIFSKSNISVSKPYAELPPYSLTQALDLALEDRSQKTSPSGTEVKHMLKRSSSFTSLRCNSPRKAFNGNNADNEIAISHRQTNPSIGSYSNFSGQSESLNNNNRQIDDFSDGEDSISELSNTEDNISDIMQNYISNLISSKYKNRFCVANNRGLKEYAEINEVFDSQPKFVSDDTSVTGSKTVVNGVDIPSHIGYLNSEEISKTSCDATDNEKSSSNCTACLQYIEDMEILQEHNSLMISQCQDLKDKLVQAQNELQVTKKAAEQETNDLKEELEKYEKQYSHVQSTLDTNTKKLDSEKRKLNAEVKSLTDKISNLSFEKDKLVGEQAKLDSMVSLKHSSLEEERKLRFKAEEDVKAIKNNLDAMEVNYKQSLNNEHMLTEKVKAQEIQIKSLSSKIDGLIKNLHLRPPPQVFHHMSNQGRAIQPGHYMSMFPMPDPYRPHFFMPEGYKSHMAGNNVPLLPHQMRPINIDPRVFPYAPFLSSDVPLSPPSSKGETEAENGPVIKAGPSFTSPAKLSPSNYPPADAPSSPCDTPSSPRHVSAGFAPGMSQPPQLSSISSPVSRLTDASKSRSVESLNSERSLSTERAASSSKPPLLYAAAAAIESKQEGLNTSYGKLMHLLHKEFPTINKSRLSKFILKIRSKHNNSLSGMPLREILHEIRGKIFEDNISKDAILKNSSLKWPPSTKTSSMGLDKIPFSWGVQETQSGIKRYYGHSDECYICYELLDEGDLHSLACGHAYHSECIKRWLEVDKTCPTCRLYAPLEEEYPMLQ